MTPAGMFPRMKRFTVVGIFHVGAGELDGYLGVTNLQDLARLHRWKPDQVQGMRLKFDDLFKAPRVAWSIAQQLGEHHYYARDWTRTHGNLYQAIRMEKAMIGLLLLLIVAVAAFNIISTLVMVVNDKQGDIAILRTLGATPGTDHGASSWSRARSSAWSAPLIGAGARDSRGAQRQCGDFGAGRPDRPQVPQCGRLLHRLSAVAVAWPRMCCWSAARRWS